MATEHSFINLFRAIAAFWVLAAHCMIWGGWYGIPLPSAKIAVDLFMMISGYLMVASTSSRAKSEPLEEHKNWIHFWLRRFFRLAPVYYFSLLLAIVTNEYFLDGYKLLQELNPTIWVDGGVYDPMRIEYTLENIILHLTFLFGLHPQWSFSTFLPDWSLSLEMQFYFIFPILILLMKKKGFLKIALFVCSITLPLGLIIAHYFQYYEPSLLLFKLQYFVAGILLYSIVNSTQETLKIKVLLLAGAILLVSLEFNYGKELLVLPAILLAMFLFGWMEKNNTTPKYLANFTNSRIIRFGSDVSYVVYLVHGFFISLSGHLITSNEYTQSLPPPRKSISNIYICFDNGIYIKLLDT
jgi:peptidoglycan/LPS O-acetylase OafA/YrhL